jgi:gluconolactonase
MFEKYINKLNIKKIHTGSIWTEGPCYLKKLNKVIWSDIPNNRMLSFDFNKVETFRSPSNFSNGNTSDNQGNLITCEHGARRVTKTDQKNVISLIADEYREKRLNSPNDVCVHSDGTIFFTDPPYGIINPKRVEGFPGKMMYGGCYVFKCEPKKKNVRSFSHRYGKT